MDPMIAVGIAALTWLAVRDRHEMSRVLLAVGLFGVGWHPATHDGSGLGAVVVAMSAGVAVSLAWEGLVAAADAIARRGARRVAGCERCRRDGLAPETGPPAGLTATLHLRATTRWPDRPGPVAGS